MQSVEKRKMKDEEPIWNRKEVKRGSQISMPIREKKIFKWKVDIRPN